jgi:hypothetical protein
VGWVVVAVPMNFSHLGERSLSSELVQQAFPNGAKNTASNCSTQWFVTGNSENHSTGF